MSSHWKIVHNNRNVISDSPESLWANAISYFQWCDENPIQEEVVVQTGKEAGRKFSKNKKRMYTIKGLCLHCNIEEEYIKAMRATRNDNNEYYVVVSKILYIIYTDGLEGAAADIYNAGFVTKVLALEKEDNAPRDIKVEIVNSVAGGKSIPELSETENQILEKLELELSMKEKEEK